MTHFCHFLTSKVTFWGVRPMVKNRKIPLFLRWLKAQVDRSDPIGHLAYDTFRDSCCLPYLFSPGSFFRHMERKHGVDDLDCYAERGRSILSKWGEKFLKAVENLKSPPVLLALQEPYGYGELNTWKAWCPFCVDWHIHLAGSKLTVPLCHVERSPLLKTGYRLKVFRKPNYAVQIQKRQSVSPKLRFNVLKRDGFSCQYCGVKAPTSELRVDHRIPASGGGSDDPSNLVTACHTCNAGKGKHPL